MRHLKLVLIAAALGTAYHAPSATAQEDLQFKVHDAIRTGVNWLKSRQTPEGHWGDSSKNPAYAGGGTSYHAMPSNCAFALFCLLTCEVPTDDPVITKGFAWLRTQEWKGTYENAIIIMAFRELYFRKVQEVAKKKFGKFKDAQAKIDDYMKEKDAKDGLKYGGAAAGADWQLIEKATTNLVSWQFSDTGWRYGGDMRGNSGDTDVSATHLALFGLASALALGVRIDPKVFYTAANFLVNEQDQTGEVVQQRNPEGQGSWTPMAGDRARGWAYMKSSSEERERHQTGSMTGAGIIGLMVCKGQLLKTQYWKAIGKRVDQSIQDGIAWLDKNWIPGLTTNPHGFRGTGYYWWVVERVGILGEITLIGTNNWYVQGAQNLVGIQKKVDNDNGFWDVGAEVFPQDELNTIYALLFLKKHAHAVGIPPVTRGDK